MYCMCKCFGRRRKEVHQLATYDTSSVGVFGALDVGLFGALDAARVQDWVYGPTFRAPDDVIVVGRPIDTTKSKSSQGRA
jgi:hypothetical protein